MVNLEGGRNITWRVEKLGELKNAYLRNKIANRAVKEVENHHKINKTYGGIDAWFLLVVVRARVAGVTSLFSPRISLLLALVKSRERSRRC